MRAVLSHHRTYGSAYGGSTAYALPAPTTFMTQHHFTPHSSDTFRFHPRRTPLPSANGSYCHIDASVILCSQRGKRDDMQFNGFFRDNERKQRPLGEIGASTFFHDSIRSRTICTENACLLTHHYRFSPPQPQGASSAERRPQAADCAQRKL